MTFIAFVLVILSSIIHALWNLFAKQSINKLIFFWLIHLISFFLFLPYFLYRLPTITLEGYMILILFGSLFFQVLYVINMSLSYSLGDYSLTYPLLRGTASFLIPICSIVLFKESISIIGWIGIMIIFISILSLSDFMKKESIKNKYVVLLAVAGGLSITGYTLSDKVLLSILDPIMIFQFQNIIHILAFLWISISSGQLKQEWITNWKIILLGAIFVPGSYIIFLFALKLVQVGQLAPIREISIVFGAILGTLILKEKQGKKKIISSIFIVIGVIILAMYG